MLRTFVAHVEDRPGVLNRVVSLFRRRGYNIGSLTVGTTDKPGVSRLTVVMEADEDSARRIQADLYKLVNVLYVEDLSHAATVSRDLALLKVRASADTRPQILQLVEVFRARAVDVTTDAMVLEMCGASDKIDGLIDVLRPFGIVEMVRTGIVAMRRGGESQLEMLKAS